MAFDATVTKLLSGFMAHAYASRGVPITVDLGWYGTNPNSNYDQPAVWIVGHPLRFTAPNECLLTPMGQGSKNFRDTPPYKGEECRLKLKIGGPAGLGALTKHGKSRPEHP